MDLIERVSCARKAKHTIREIYNYERTSKSYKEWSSKKSLGQLQAQCLIEYIREHSNEPCRYGLVYNNLTFAAKCLLLLPQSTWTLDDLERYAVDPRHLDRGCRRGCYMLAAIGVEDDEDTVELYIGHSMDMTSRFSTHVSRIKSVIRHEHDHKVQYFHRRCHQLGVTRPLFIRLSSEPTQDKSALKFQETACIAMMGTWGGRDVPKHHIAVWKAVRRMRLADENDVMPDRWHGANREIPFLSSSLISC